MWEKLIEAKEWTKFQPEDEPEAAKEGELSPEDQEAITRKWERALTLVAHPEIPKRISLIDLDVKIVAGSSMPTNRIAKSMLAMEKLQAGMYDVEAALEYDDDPAKDKIVARMKAREESGMMEDLQK
jgi:hypothetical protein